MTIKPVIFTTVNDPGNEWFRTTFQKIYRTVTLTKGLTIEPFEVVHFNPYKDFPISKNGKIDWPFFEKIFTKLGAEMGYNCILMHCTQRWKKQWGLNPEKNGTYRSDKNGLIEIYVCASSEEEFQRVTEHEILHFVERTVFNNQNEPTVAEGVQYDSRTHAYAYGHKNIQAGYKTFDLTKVNPKPVTIQIMELMTKAVELMGILQKRPMYPLEKQKFLYNVSQRFGKRDSSYRSGIHTGTDWALPIGTNIFAPCDNFEIYRTYSAHRDMGNAAYGKGTIDGHEYHFRFLHLLRTPEKKVHKKGAVIAQTGNTGRSTGPHLHVDMWRVPIDSKVLYTEASVLANLLDPYKFFIYHVDNIIV